MAISVQLVYFGIYVVLVSAQFLLFYIIYIFTFSGRHTFDPQFSNQWSGVAVDGWRDLKMGFYVEVESKIDTAFEIGVSLPPAMVLDEFLDNVFSRR